MFTGIVEEVGSVVSSREAGDGWQLRVHCGQVHTDAAPGASIAVNGCCLTVVEVDGADVTFDVVPETLARTNLGAAAPGALVNLERSLRPSDRLAGHVVQGHVDGSGTVGSVTATGNATVIEVAAAPDLMRWIAEKGSIAVDGVSLTVAAVVDGGFQVWIIPFTRDHTTLGSLAAGDRVNLECDVLAKYVDRLLQPSRCGDGPVPDQ